MYLPTRIAGCISVFKPAWERERERGRDVGQRFIDMSFQSTVYPSEEMYLCTVGGISICCKISRNNTAWSPQYCTVFSLADLFALSFSHTHVHIKRQSCQQDPSPFISIPPKPHKHETSHITSTIIIIIAPDNVFLSLLLCYIYPCLTSKANHLVWIFQAIVNLKWYMFHPSTKTSPPLTKARGHRMHPQQKGAIYFEDEKTFSTILLQKYTHTLSCYPFFWLGFRWEFCFIHILHCPFLRFVKWWRQIWGGDLKKKMHYLSQKSYEIIPHNKLFLYVSIICFLKVER